MSTLYDIMSEMDFLEGNLIDEETGEIDEEIFDRLENLQIEKDQKIESIACIIKSDRADAKSIKTEADSLKRRATSLENTADRLERWLDQILDGEKFETSRCRIGFRRTQSVSILDENVIPDEFVDVRVERKPVKSLIKEALKEGKEVNGAVLIDRRNINVR